MSDEILTGRPFVKDKIFDCLKMIGAAAGSGFLASLIAISSTSGKTVCLIKPIAILLGGSVVLFCFSVASFIAWLASRENVQYDYQAKMRQGLSEEKVRLELDRDATNAKHWFMRTIWFGLSSFLIVLVCVLLVVRAVWVLPICLRLAIVASISLMRPPQEFR